MNEASDMSVSEFSSMLCASIIMEFKEETNAAERI